MTIVAETATLVHGYTMADVTRISRVALSRHTRSRWLDQDDRMEAAWYAIVEALYSHDDPPTFYEVLYAALTALDHEVTEHNHHHGITSIGEAAPKFDRYWLPVRGERTDGFTDRVVEALALPSVLSVLTAKEYEAIATLAVYDNDMGAAAAAVGVKYRAFQRRVFRARQKIKEVWFEGEPPAQRKRTDEACMSGHSRAEFGHQGPDGKWVCRMCRRASRRRQRARASGVPQVVSLVP